MSDREIYMQEALRLAEEAAACGDVPVGCVIADADGSIIGSGRNRREENRDATAHAEVEAIREACITRGSWRLDDCTLFVTLEPCPPSWFSARGKRTADPAAASLTSLPKSSGTARRCIPASVQWRAAGSCGSFLKGGGNRH